MIDSRWRGVAQPLFNKLAKGFIYLKIKPNTITLIAAFVGLISGFCFAFGYLLAGVILLWTSGLLDSLDGTVARLTKGTTKTGAYLDLVLDRMVEAAVILGFAWLLPEHYFAYILFLVAVIFNFTTFIVAGALFENNGYKGMHYDVGIAERTETFLTFTLMAIFSQHLFFILMFFNGLVFITGANRFYKVMKYAEEVEPVDEPKIKQNNH
jgi:archaetidylinositol phosphate synthase